MARTPSFQAGKWLAAVLVLLAILAYLFGSRLGAQQLRVPDSLVVAVGDTVRPAVTVLDRGRVVAHPALTYSSADALLFGATRDGRVLARAVGCAPWRVTHAPYVRASVPVCVVAAVPTPVPDSTPAPAPAAGVVFASDWSHGLGATEAAVKDGGRWPIGACNWWETLTVVDRASVGLDSVLPDYGGHALRVQMRGPGSCGMLQRNQAVPASTTHWGRFYVRNDEQGSRNGHAAAYNNVHPGSAIQLMPWTRDARLGGGAPGAGRWMISVGGDGGYPYTSWNSPPLENGRWYRYEWQVEYVTATTVRLWPRVYDAAGVLRFTAAHFRHWESASDPTTLAQWYAAGHVIRLAGGTGADPELARHYGMGNEGPSSAPDTRGYWYYAKLALGTAGWIGR